MKRDKKITRTYIVMPGDNKTTIVIFAGLGHMIDGIGPFNFVKSFGDYDCQRIFFRDLKSVWYHNGINEDIDTIEKLAEMITTLSNRSEKLVMVGCSAGGYAAILFGHLCKADRVIAFSPQVVLDDQHRAKIKDFRYARCIQNLPKHGRKYRNLKELLNDHNGKTKYEIHVGKLRKDVRNANLIRPCSGVTIKEYNTICHHVAKRLKQRGRLKDILEKAITR